MELRVLNYFLVIANEKNFTKASQLLHITQPPYQDKLLNLKRNLAQSYLLETITTFL